MPQMSWICVPNWLFMSGFWEGGGQGGAKNGQLVDGHDAALTYRHETVLNYGHHNAAIYGRNSPL